MKIRNILLLFVIHFACILFLSSSVLYAQNVKAFPGAEGFGQYSKGGRGGKIIKVTNLNDSGIGSLRRALEDTMPRIVVFEVGGLIDLETPIFIDHPYITIAGQTAPYPGITIRGNGIRIYSHNVIMRFLKIRPGDVDFGPPNGWGGVDALTISSRPGEVVHDIIIDHCSLSWAVDENMDAWGDGYNITIQNTFITEALSNSKHPKGAHSKGMLVGLDIDRLTIYNNLFAHNANRSPRISNGGLVEVLNNVIYNYGQHAMKISNGRHQNRMRANIIGNRFIKGPSSGAGLQISIWDPENQYGLLYLSGNKSENSGNTDWDIVQGSEGWVKNERLSPEDYESFKVDTPFETEFEGEFDSNYLYDYLLKQGGASIPSRDAIDSRIITELKERKGKIIDSQSEKGGWNILSSRSSRVDENENGIADTWEEDYSMNEGDEHLDYDNDGYTNIEEFLNGTHPDSDINLGSDIFLHYREDRLTSSINENLIQIYPNPFSNRTNLEITIKERDRIKITIYNVLGQKVHEIFNNEVHPGVYQVEYEPDQLSSGVYIILLNSNFGTIGKKFTIVNGR
jgi:pectate lyase